MAIFIYGLVDPRDDTVRYVGKTIDLENRFLQHLREHGSTRKCKWINKLLKLGLKPDLIILEKIENNFENKWDKFESKWIGYYKKLNGELFCNHTDGGDGVHNPSRESREKLSISRKKLFQDDEFRKKFLAWVKSPERCKKISKALTGKKKSVEHIKKLPQNRKGFKHSPEFSEKISKARLGSKHSEETKQKLKLLNLGNKYGIGNKSRTGQKQSVEEKLKKSLATKGMPKSEEWKAKMRGRKQSPEWIEKRKKSYFETLEKKRRNQDGEKLYQEP